jgi:chlorite dismutase
MAALPPATLEGWFVLHQVFSFDWNGLRKMSAGERAALAADAEALFAGFGAVAEGWSDHFRLVGGGADVMFVHFRATLEELADVQLRVRSSALGQVLRLELDYLSVTEAGLYHATAQAATASRRPSRPRARRSWVVRTSARASSPACRKGCGTCRSIP